MRNRARHSLLLSIAIVMTMGLVACSGGGEADGGQQAAAEPSTEEQAMHTVTIVAEVPEDAPTTYVAGNLPALGPWHPAALEMKGTGARRTATVSVPHGYRLEYKITAGSWEREGLGPSGTVMPAFTAAVDKDMEVTAQVAGFRQDPRVFIADWQGADIEGELVYWLDVESENLAEPRHVVTWLPPGYDASSDRTYKVIYMHDGQNLFDPRISYTNVDWGVDEAMMRGVKAGDYEPAIIVGVWNTTARLREYSPWDEAASYAKFLLTELMPKVNEEFNVAQGRENTFVMGSSMGGLVSFYLVKEHPDVFSACGCVSTHFTWSQQMLDWSLGKDPSQSDPEPFVVKDIAGGATMPKDVRLYFDYGTEGLDAAYDGPHQAVKAWLLEQGFEEGTTLKMQQFDGADHNETAWRARVDQQLAWMLGDGSG
ncbi:MAG: alpha/beta hydrolase-fold protein [Pseudomonadota bacterium]